MVHHLCHLLTSRQASVNHERIAEGLSEALCALSEHVVECKAELEIFSTQAMLALVAEFYASVFLFLSDTMDYFMEKKRKRLLDSFNEDFYHKFESQIERIKHRSNRIRNLAAQNSRAEQRATRLIVEDIAHDVRFGLAGEARHRAEMAHYAERVEKELVEVKREAKLLREEGRPFRELADRLTQMLEGGAMGWLGDMREADCESLTPRVTLYQQELMINEHSAEIWIASRGAVYRIPIKPIPCHPASASVSSTIRVDGRRGGLEFPASRRLLRSWT